VSKDPLSVNQLAPDEPLSPELVLVFSPELRAQALASLGPPVWPAPRPRVSRPAVPVDEPFGRALGQVLVSRVLQLGLIFVAVTILTLAMSVVAHAIR
jgi:hypothetical protein